MIELFNMPNRPRTLEPLEIARVTRLTPFTIKINSVEYSTDDFPIYVPRKYMIEQKDEIRVDLHRAYVDRYDLELEADPDQKPTRFNVGDLVLISDMGNQIIVITALYGLPKGAGL